MPDADENLQGIETPPRTGRLWPWFAVGFVVVFIALSLTVTMYTMSPAGDTVSRVKLWQYYVIKIPRTFGLSPRLLGPDTTSAADVLTVALQHTLVSGAGGAVTLGIGWVVHAIRGRPRPSA